MKKILFLLVGLFLGEGASAQVWDKTYPGTQYLFCLPTIQCYDPGIAIAQYFNGSNSCSIMKTDVNGNVIFRSYLLPDSSSYQCINTTADGGFILGGTTSYGYSSNHTFLLKLNACGQKEWSAFYADRNMENNYVNDVHQLKDGGYIMTIDQYNNGDAVCRLDSTGKSLWTIVINGGNFTNI